jgi:hypothetical protein
MAYSDYLYYTSGYRGKLIPDKDFGFYAQKATAYLDFVTSDNTQIYVDTDNRLKNACCAVAEIMYSQSGQSGKKSESIDSYSVTYADNYVNDSLNLTARMYLGSTGLLYRGL